MAGSYTAKSPEIRDLRVQAIWDGLPEHPVHVRIHCTIKPESGLQIPILECDGERVTVISVVTTNTVESGLVDRETTALRQCSDEFSGETLTVFNAGLFLRNSFMVMPSMNMTTTEQKRRLVPRSDDIFSAGRPWATGLPDFDRQTSASAIGAFGYQFSEINDNDSLHLVPYNSIINDNRSTSADTVEIHLLSRPPSPFGADGLGPLDIPGPGSPEGAGHQVVEVSDALDDGPPQKLRVKKRAKSSKRQAPKEKTPWQSPSQEDFCTKSKQSTKAQPSALLSPTYAKPTSMSKPSKLAIARGTTLRTKSTEPLRQTSGNCLVAGTSPGLKQSPSALGRLRANTPQKTEENAAIRTRPVLSEPKAVKPMFDQSVQSLNSDGPGLEWFHIFEDLQDKGNDGSSPHPLTPSRSPLGLPSQLQDQPHSQQPSPLTCIGTRDASNICMPHISGKTSSPTTCVRIREPSKTCMPHSSGQELEVDSSLTWVIEDGKLMVCFPEAITSTPFEIDVEAEVHLVSLNGHDWQSFSLAVCSHFDPGNVSGSFSFIIEQQLGQSDIPDAQFRTESLFDSHVVAAKQITGMFIAAERLQLALRFKEPILTIPFYTMGVGLCGTAIWSENEGFQIKYRASLTIEHPDYDFFADQITLYLNIRNCSACTDTYRLGKGETSVVLRDDYQPLDCKHSDLTEASLAIVRDAADIGSSLELVFTVFYGRTSPITVALPHIHPAYGKVVNETVFISNPSPSLFIEHRSHSSFSTWKTTEYIKDDIRSYRFDRDATPFAFPEGLKDNVIVKLVRQAPVHFKAFEELNGPVANAALEHVVHNFKLNVAQMLGGMLECRMTLDVQVTKSCHLLTIDHHDWNPKLSLIDGRLATEDVAEWRETVDGDSTLFKTERMVPGQTISIEFQWEEWGIPHDFEEAGYSNIVVYHLPRVVGKIVLDGSLQCDVNGGTVTMDDGVGKAVYWSFDPSGRDTVRLPTLRDGYNMELAFHRDGQTTCYPPPRLGHNLPTQATPPRGFFAGGIPLASRQVRFADELFDSSRDAVDEISASLVRDSDLESNLSSKFLENPLPALTESIRSGSAMPDGSTDAVDGMTVTVAEDSDLESIFSSEFDENPLPVWTASPKSEGVVPEGSGGAVDEITAVVVEDSDIESILSSEFDENSLPALTGSTESERTLPEGSNDAVDEISATIAEDSDQECIYSSEFDEIPLPGCTASIKSDRAKPSFTTPFRKTRSIIRRNNYRWCCLLVLGFLFRRLLDPDVDAATSALKHVQRITTNIERLALSIVPVPWDDATLRIQLPRQHTGNNEDATTRVQEWVLSATADGDVGIQAAGAGSRGDTEMVHYKSSEVTEVDSERGGVHGVGYLGNGRSVRDWIDYTLGWKGEA